MMRSAWDESRGPFPAWSPSEEVLQTCNEGAAMAELNFNSYDAFHAWSIDHREAFWSLAIEKLSIQFRTKPTAVADLSQGAEHPVWLPGCKLNIVESCFSAPPNSPAIIFQGRDGSLQSMTVRELESLTNRVANGLSALGLQRGDRIAVVLPMTVASVAIYLGTIKLGAAIVSIADSFMPKEIAARLEQGEATVIFTQDFICRGGKTHRLYERVTAAGAPTTIVIPDGGPLEITLREGDLSWDVFLSDDDSFEALPCGPDDAINILFSSGTTDAPKAIVWHQTTPIRCATDGYFHQNIQPGDVIAWPTNLGWMMGPWLIFASLMNRATMALSCEVPTSRGFGQFIADARVTMLGVVPSLVSAWRTSGCLEGLDWHAIKVFSSTGECSNPTDYLWLMSRAGYRPVIEYCGGTEIGGAYITGTVMRPSSPATFNTLALGLDATIVDELGSSAKAGEMYIIPPSIGLSSRVLNRDHHEQYFAGSPNRDGEEILRRHGDEMESLPGGYFRALGRADDTMNLGGIKVSSVAIERALCALPDVREAAAVAAEPTGGGPSHLIIYAVAAIVGNGLNDNLLAAMRKAIKEEVNPLFKIHQLILVESLPRTASNKVMRRVLRERYREER
jgi:acetyl-CoA synthetase